MALLFLYFCFIVFCFFFLVIITRKAGFGLAFGSICGQGIFSPTQIRPEEKGKMEKEQAKQTGMHELRYEFNARSGGGGKAERRRSTTQHRHLYT